MWKKQRKNTFGTTYQRNNKYGDDNNYNNDTSYYDNDDYNQSYERERMSSDNKNKNKKNNNNPNLNLNLNPNPNLDPNLDPNLNPSSSYNNNTFDSYYESLTHHYEYPSETYYPQPGQERSKSNNQNFEKKQQRPPIPNSTLISTATSTTSFQRTSSYNEELPPLANLSLNVQQTTITPKQTSSHPRNIPSTNINTNANTNTNINSNANPKKNTKPPQPPKPQQPSKPQRAKGNFQGF